MSQEKSFELNWSAHEYEHKEREQDWFWAVGIITMSVAIASIVFGNIIFAILILISAFALSLFINRFPEIINVSIDNKGVTKGNVRYPFETLHSFWVDLEHPHKKIIFKSKKLLMPLIIVPLGDHEDIDALKDVLDNYLTEEYQRLPFAETLLEYLGF